MLYVLNISASKVSDRYAITVFYILADSRLF